MAVLGKPIKFYLTNADGEEVELSHHVVSFELPQVEVRVEPVRLVMPAVEVSFPIGNDSEFARALRRFLRRKWTLEWLRQFAAWAFGSN